MTACAWRTVSVTVFAWVVLCAWPGAAAGAGAQTDSTGAAGQVQTDSTRVLQRVQSDSTNVLHHARPDSIAAVESAKTKPRSADTPLHAGFADTLKSGEFRSRHAFSLGHFFEMWPGFILGRRGPIGADAEFSKYGIGRGRGVLYLGNVPLNDPQDDRIPLALVPTTLVGEIVEGAARGPFLPERSNIEGSYRIDEPAAPVDRPVVAIELGTGDRGLRQRRARFSTMAGTIGIDFELDELRNDGYSFDARGVVQGSGYGRSTMRSQGGNVRGELPGGAGYLFSFRRFTSTFDGDLNGPDNEQRRDGHLAVMRTSFAGVDLSVFERSHEMSVPDSATSNNTAGVYVSVPVRLSDDIGLTIGAGYEDIHSRQRMGDEESRPRLQKAHFGLAADAALPAGVIAVVEANASHSFDMSTGWGAGVTVGRRWNSANEASVSFKRRFRMPNLGELFQPRHDVTMDPSLELAGNRYVKPEAAIEASAQWAARVGGLTNAIGATALRVQDPILYDSVTGEGSLSIAQNGVDEDLVVFAERAGFQRSVVGVLFELGGSVEYTPSDRERFFSSVPEYRATACAAVGSDFFRKTSGFRLSAEYQHGGERKAGSANSLPAYDVVNVKLVVRLIDAHLYVQWLNVTDAKYQTVWPYLMTPKTFVYGVEWTIFD